MIRDFAAFDAGTAIAADLCIVGSGAAGIALAREFIGTRFSVLVLEAGGLAPKPETQRLYESEVVGLPSVSIHEGRARIFGGTTVLWGGQALRFDSFDLQPRSWVPYSGWPITREELEPYYNRAARVLRLGPAISYQDLCTAFGIVPPVFDPAQLYLECSQWSPKPNLGTVYRRELEKAPNVTVLLHANVTSIVSHASAAAIEKIEFRTLQGKAGAASARAYIVCCGGMETARLLLASDRVESRGLGNRRDLVGRFFQEHIHIRLGRFVTHRRKALQNYFESFYRRRLKYFPLLTLSPRTQAERRILSIHGSVTFGDNPDSGIVALKQLFTIFVRGTKTSSAELHGHLLHALASPADMFRLGYRLLVQKRAGTSSRGPIFLGAQAEMAPHPDSRITLSEARDALGMRKIRLDWRLGELERKTLCEFTRIAGAECERLGLGTLDSREAALLDEPATWSTLAHDSAHHMGTTRMHESPEFGVVDSRCRVHGVANLYIASSSVFPTSARSNPTLTILALCMRLADHLKRVLE